MSLDHAVRLTEILLALAFIQQSIEHCFGRADERRLFLPRLFLSIVLMLGVAAPYIGLVLLVNSLYILRRFQGPYNGGSDRMGLLALCCLCFAHFLPSMRWREYMFGYLALQCVLSYFIAGGVKIINPEWRSGRALQDVLLFSAYSVSESLRKWADWPRLLCGMSWLVMLFELLFPLSLTGHVALVIGLALAAGFHLANAFLFGLNRFFWVWIAAYPSLIWLQHRI